MVCDGCNETVAERDALREIAHCHRVPCSVIWLDVPASMAHSRRAENPDHADPRRHVMSQVELDRHINEFEPPLEGGPVFRWPGAAQIEDLVERIRAGAERLVMGADPSPFLH